MTQKALKLVCLGILVLLLGIPSLAQNTKGDKPTPPNRETRFKTPKKSKQKRQPSRRVRRGDDRAGAPAQMPARKRQDGERPGKPITPQFSKSRPSKSDKPWKGGPSGLRIRPRKETSRAKNVYPQPSNINYSSRNLKRVMRDNENPNVKRVRRMQREESDKPRVGKPIKPMFHKTRPQRSERAWRGDLTGRPIRAGSSDGLRPPPGAPARVIGTTVRPRERRKGVVPPSISGRARNNFSRKGFFVNRQSRQMPRFQSEQSRVALSLLKRYNNRRQRQNREGKVTPRSASANYLARRSTNTWAHFPRPKRKQERATTRDLAGHKLRGRNYETPRGVITNPTLNYQRRVAVGERPYKGTAAGGYDSRTRSGRAWKGDIAHRAIRGGFRSKKGEPRPGGAIFGRGPGRDARNIGNYQGDIKAGRRGFTTQGEEYSGNIRAGKPLKGGGSVSGGWNNKGQPINGRTPGKGSERIGYSGNIRAGKRVFNNQGEEYSGDIPAGRGGFNDQGEEYTGNIKARRPERGGGSRSGKLWNNNNTPILVRTPSGKSARIAGYQGNLRAGQRIYNDQGEEYTGNIKTRRPEKGGESVSGKLWNNNERAIDGRSYVGQTKINRYAGNLKAKRPEKGGGSVSGVLWNNEEKPIEGRAYVGQTKLSRFSGNMKARRPDKGGSEGDDFSGSAKISRNAFKRNPKSAEGAMPGMKASAASLKADQHSRGVRRDWNFIRNPSSADEAQKTREPGRAFGRSGDFQGNIRIKKFDLFGKSDLHPDARFVKTNKNNVDEEKDMLTNFKLWWARLFRKAETQPDHLKEKDKDRKPRYDKGEAGLWYE